MVDGSMAYANCHADDDNNHRHTHNMNCHFSLLLSLTDRPHTLSLHLNGMCLMDKLKLQKIKNISIYENNIYIYYIYSQF